MNEPTNTLGDLQTIGHACGQWQQSPRFLRVALDALDKQPKLRLNGLDYFDTADFEAAVRWLAQNSAESFVASRVEFHTKAASDE